MDSTFTTKIGEKFMDSLVNNALNGINSNSNGNSNGSQHQDQPRQYGYHGQPQWYRGHKGRGFHGNPSQGGGDRAPLHDKVDACVLRSACWMDWCVRGALWCCVCAWPVVEWWSRKGAGREGPWDRGEEVFST